MCVLLALGFYWLMSPLPPPRVLRYRQLTSDRQIKNVTPCGYDPCPVTRDGQKGELTRDQSYSQEDPTMITDSDVSF